VVVSFDHSYGGLSFRGGTGESWEIAGPSGEFVPAAAALQGDTGT
jgi:hypothetical protein